MMDYLMGAMQSRGQYGWDSVKSSVVVFLGQRACGHDCRPCLDIAIF